MSETGNERSARYSDPITERGGWVGRGAVLYDKRPVSNRTCCDRDQGRHLYHVVGVYEETETGEVYYKVADGTWTVEEWIHADDLLALFEPAGWSVTSTKPTYLLTRDHGVEDHHDLMTDGGTVEDGTEQTSHEKGQRHEREACDILKRVYGSGVEKVDTFTNHDPFGFVDIIAMSPEEQIKFVQVKTNTIPAKDLQKYKRRARLNLPLDHAEFEVWLRVDREGWKLLKYNTEDFEKYGTLPCNTSEAREQFHSLHADTNQPGGEH